jgi:DNA-binding response OmpR family regulator
MQKILVVEDDEELNQLVCFSLKREKYEAVFAHSVAEAKEKYSKNSIRLVLLDVNLPDGEGFLFCKWVKEQKETPVIFLTARDLEEDALTGYDLGAEDYVTKPFSMKILMRKVAVILNRAVAEQEVVFENGHLQIDFSAVKVLVKGKECPVTPTEFKLLKQFVLHKGQLLTYEVLLERLWDCDSQFVDKHALAVNVNRLRRKIEDDKHKYISNVYGMGYQWVG